MEEEAELAELAVDGVLATPAMPMRAGVEVMAAAGAALAAAGTAAAIAELGTAAVDAAADATVGVGRVLLGGDINARGAFGGLKADEDEVDEGEGGIRPA